MTDKIDTLTFIVLGLLLILQAGLAIQYVYGESPNSFTMCSLTANGAWDCEHKWLVILHNTNKIRCIEVSLKLTNGCAVWGTPNYRGNMPYMEIDNSTGKDSYGNSILWHEIKHLQCKCNWHK